MIVVSTLCNTKTRQLQQKVEKIVKTTNNV